MDIQNISFLASLDGTRRNERVVHGHDDHDFELIDEDAFMPAPDFEIVAKPLRRAKRRYTREEIRRELDRHALAREIRHNSEPLKAFNLRFIPR